jgi:hypothetical protein
VDAGLENREGGVGVEAKDIQGVRENTVSGLKCDGEVRADLASDQDS